MVIARWMICLFFFFNDTATTEIYTLSLHDALPISPTDINRVSPGQPADIHFLPYRQRYSKPIRGTLEKISADRFDEDRKSTRLNSSHANISYAVFCLKKKKKIPYHLNSVSIIKMLS